MSEWNALSSAELLPDRPFTDPDCIRQDVAVLSFTLHQLRTLVSQPARLEQTHWVEAAGRTHRFILSAGNYLLTLPTLTLVGFFGQRRRDADVTPINHLDGELVQTLAEHPGLLSYCTLLQENGDYGNVVLFASEESKLHWSTSERHAYAVRLSPKYYDSVRLHNGYVPGGLMSGSAPVVERTKYLDYRGMLPWRGMREFASDART